MSNALRASVGSGISTSMPYGPWLSLNTVFFLTSAGQSFAFTNGYFSANSFCSSASLLVFLPGSSTK